MAKTSASPSPEILEAALQGLEAQKLKLDEQIAEVRAMMGKRGGRSQRSSGTATAISEPERTTARKRRILSPEARKRIAAAQKKRWAAFRKSQE
jgi:hypothetical protein